MSDFTSRTVSVGLDVHAASIRLAAVRADELLEERTLPYDHEAVERVIECWPGARVCYEAGPTGSVWPGTWPVAESLVMSSRQGSCRCRLALPAPAEGQLRALSPPTRPGPRRA